MLLKDVVLLPVRCPLPVVCIFVATTDRFIVDRDRECENKDIAFFLAASAVAVVVVAAVVAVAVVVVVTGSEATCIVFLLLVPSSGGSLMSPFSSLASADSDCC
jgi:hypothetical protein